MTLRRWREDKMSMETYRFQLFRARTPPDADGRAPYFYTAATERHRRALFFRPHEVPEFEGDSAWFEARRHDGQWRIVRRVDELEAPLGSTGSLALASSAD